MTSFKKNLPLLLFSALFLVTDASFFRRRTQNEFVDCPPASPCFAARQDCVSGSCVCKEGWSNENNDYCATDVDECTTLSPCDNGPGGVCVDKAPNNGRYKCLCKDGYTGLNPNDKGPTLCLESDSCYFNNDLCHIRAECKEQANGQYRCECAGPFFVGDGLTCSFFDPSPAPTPPPSPAPTVDPCDACRENEVCTSANTCVCKTGYFSPSGVGGACQDLNECASPNDNDCSRNAICNNFAGGYNCICKTGYTGNGQTCNDQNECDTAGICGSGKVCINTVGSYNCISGTAPPTRPPTSQPVSTPTRPPTSPPTSPPNSTPATPLPTPYPTPNPTPDPTPLPTFGPTPDPTPQPTNLPQRCDDSRYEKFQTDEVPDAGMQRCVWLATRPSKQPTYCQPSHPSGAYDLCEETCGKCSDDCEDTNGYFDYENKQGVINSRPCNWLEIRPDVIEEVCQEGYTAHDVTCPETCDSCDIPEASTTHAPTATATQAPSCSPTKTVKPSSSPTDRPSASPSSSPSVFVVTGPFCDDSLEKRFPDDNGKDQPCVWLAARPDEQTTYCNANHPSGAYDLCEETCGKCTDNCNEDLHSQFTLDDTIRDCLWLSLRPSKVRQVCVEGNEAYDACPETCDKCDAVCEDTEGTFAYDGEQRTCEWLAGNPTVQEEICRAGLTAHDIVCRATCMNCN